MRDGHSTSHRVQVTYGPPDIIGRTADDKAVYRHKRFEMWYEDGKRMGRWTWQPGFPSVEWLKEGR